MNAEFRSSWSCVETRPRHLPEARLKRGNAEHQPLSCDGAECELCLWHDSGRPTRGVKPASTTSTTQVPPPSASSARRNEIPGYPDMRSSSSFLNSERLPKPDLGDSHAETHHSVGESSTRQQSGGGREAYVTMVTTAKYLIGAEVLAKSLRAFRASRPLVALLDSSLPVFTVCMLCERMCTC